MTINGHELPAILSELIKTGEWASLSRSSQLSVVFLKADIANPSFYEEDSLKLENTTWPDENDSAYIGVESLSAPPGDIDPTRSVLIADLGPDRPIALDYRTSSSPRVVYLAEGDDANWIEAAPSIEALIENLRCEDGRQ